MQIFAKSAKWEQEMWNLHKNFTTFSNRNEIKIYCYHFLISSTEVNKMKVVLSLLVCLSIAVAHPLGEDGANFANEAIKQAQTSLLIPHDAIIQNVKLSFNF